MNPDLSSTATTDIQFESTRLVSRQHVVGALCVWLVLITASFVWNWHLIERSVAELARVQAQSHFEKDLVYRRWGAMHGGVYVPPTEGSPPNPYLAAFPERDLQAQSGKALTLINPAYMTRQVHELAAQQDGVRGHITSLQPIRPENIPDEWEKNALISFEKGVKEAVSKESIDGVKYLRYMRPLLTEAPCLKCHESQGYRLGDVRGGISVAVPFAPYISMADHQFKNLLLGHGVFAALGVVALWLFARRLERMEDQLIESEYRWKFAVEGSGDGVWDWDLQKDEASYSLRAKQILGYQPEEMLPENKAWFGYLHPEDQPAAIAALETYLRGTATTYSVEYRFKCPDGGYKWILSRGMAVRRNSKGAPVRLIGTFTDMTQRHLLEEEVRRLAFHDPLTQLPNRRLLSDRLTRALMATKRDERYGALLFLDLDGFKPLNDAHGHEIGDLLLIEAAKRLKSCVREVDTVARFGGDEFVVVLNALGEDETSATTQAGFVAEKIRTVLSEPYRLTDTVEHHCTASIGVALFISHEASQDDLLKRADAAMYQAKKSGRNSICFAGAK